MARYKADVTFKGIEEKKTFAAGEEFEMTVKRADEIQKNIKDNYDIEVKFERLDKPETRKTDEKPEEETEGEV